MRHDRRPSRWLAAATALTLLIVGVAQPAHAAPAPFPDRFEWFSSDILASPRPDAAHPVVDGLKDPTIVFSGGKCLVFASVANAEG